MDAAELRRIARAISAVEDRSGTYETILAEAYGTESQARVIGVTGPPGAGKSTLTDALAAHWGGKGARVGVLAIDPSSPFSGGALLGDRIRQSQSAALPNVYFRSLSSHGQVGGLSEVAADILAVLDHAGFAYVLIETVGAGQADTEISEISDCTVVTLVPGLGDGVQAAKAGVMEIGDVFVLNKADLAGAQAAARTLEQAIATAYHGKPGVNRGEGAPAPGVHSAGAEARARRHGDLAEDRSAWVPPVIRTAALSGSGIDEAADAVDRFVAWADEAGRRQMRRQERLRRQILRVLSSLLIEAVSGPAASQGLAEEIENWVDRASAGKASPLEAARALVALAPAAIAAAAGAWARDPEEEQGGEDGDRRNRRGAQKFR